MGKIIDVFFPMIANHRINKSLRRKLDSQNKAGKYIEHEGVLTGVENSDKLSLETLKEQYSDTFRTKNKLEDKAKTSIIAVAISITLIMGASGVFSVFNEKYSFPVSWILFVLFVFSVLYMLIAGLLVLHLLSAENKIYVVELNSLASGGTNLRDDYAKCISQNQIMNTIRNNHLFTSYKCIQNALIGLFIILFFVAIPFSSPSNDTHEILTHTSQPYSFFFSSSAVDFIKENKLCATVESAIISKIKNSDLSDVPKTFGIIDNSSSLFIKFEVSNSSVRVLLIEPYTMP
jgi:hypothetical protein